MAEAGWILGTTSDQCASLGALQDPHWEPPFRTVRTTPGCPLGPKGVPLALWSPPDTPGLHF